MQKDQDEKAHVYNILKIQELKSVYLLLDENLVPMYQINK